MALLAADAVGAEHVSCVVMPSPHSSAETQADARTIASNLGCELVEIPIETAMGAYEGALGPFGAAADGSEAEPLPRDPTLPSEPDLAAENVQARIRGNLMMALSNEHGWLVLTTGNKSEMSVGYATLYGDMAGGFAVIKDVPKTLVYELVRRRNERAGRELVPASVLEREPSAELRPGQLDSDSLPLRAARPHPRRLRRARRGAGGDDRRRAAGRRGRRGGPDGRPLRVQAPPGRAGHPHHPEGLRPRQAPADHESVRGIGLTAIVI